MHNLKELKIWVKAIDLTVDIYKATENFPREEKFGLTSQIRRSAVSIPSNISEGAGRNSINEFCHFLGIANGSSYELQTQLIISNKLELITEEKLDNMLGKLDEIQKMNYRFQERLKQESI
ncbi:four helix bundle protein [Solitalea sp. MAHUQ-68]|uniref:Four helix bundle protein n=1 Tax=Solitalea agri TaxID=2953739 RepID=A0A9X2F8S4_9SPHI|nr:four helix bundle protein [Solitalea agri]MCO4293838.1 four helix bundle protein [Solitalea agri]